MISGCYLCIDLKSFYASVECVERGLDPLKTKLVVADAERGERTVCLAATPALKKMGVKNRCRLFEIPQGISYIKATPRMKLYMKYSSEIYKIYLKYFNKDDIHVYSVDEVFIDAAKYLKMYGGDAGHIAEMVMGDVLRLTGITAACGIGSNLYLSKVALDIMAENARGGIAVLDEEKYRQLLWDHKPITDFWRIGKGTADRLGKYGIYTMRQVASADRGLLRRNFGKDAQLLIDHAWGREPVTIEDIKSYIPKERSITAGQVLPKAYDFEKGKLIMREMICGLCIELTEKSLLVNSVSLFIGHFRESASPGRGSISLPFYTASCSVISKKAGELYDKIAGGICGIRRVHISLCGAIYGRESQFDFFNTAEDMDREKRISETVIDIRHKYGKNSVISAMNLEEGSTAVSRNNQIGGHKA